MSATTIRGSSPAQQLYSGSYPLSVRGVLIGFPNQGPLHTLGYWQSDNAVDIAAPVGTDVVAVASGFVRARGDWGAPYNLASQASGRGLLLLGDDGSNYFYSRLSQRLVTDGEYVVVGQVLGKSGGSNGVPHLHVAIQPSAANQVLNPSFERDVLGAAPANWATTIAPGPPVYPYSVFQVQNAWASEGGQGLAATTPALGSGNTAAMWMVGPTVAGTAKGGFVVTPGTQVAVRAAANVTAVGGQVQLATSANWYTAAGAFVSASSGAPLGSLGAAQLADIFTVPATVGLVAVFFIVTAGASGGSMSYFLDGALVATAPVLTLVPGYSDADRPTDPLARWG